MDNEKKDYLTKLSVREIRLKAMKSSIHLYSRKNKDELVELIFKDRENVLIEDRPNDAVKTEEERSALENVKAEEERKAFENAKAEEERSALGNAKAQEELNINADINFNLKKQLSKTFPNKIISVTDNMDGSQTILIL